jgi:hypothetical protein
MKNIEDVLEDIKSIDCQADQLQDKIKSAYEGYQYEEQSDVVIKRDESLDEMGFQAYSTHVGSRKAPKVIAVVKEGQDHYVSTVVDAYIQ